MKSILQMSWIINIMEYRSIVVLLCFVWIGQSILFSMKGSNVRKCFYTEHSPDKTLQARLGILRRERGRCHARFSIFLIDSDGQKREQIYSKGHLCQQAKTNDPYVVKHTSQQQDYQGSYEVCVEMLENENENVIIEIFMGEKLNPIIFEHSDSPLPLIQSQDLIDLDLTAQSIKRSLVKSRNFSQKNRENGQRLDAKITELMQLNQFSNIMQIFTLMVFGFCWVRLAKRLKKQK